MLHPPDGLWAQRGFWRVDVCGTADGVEKNRADPSEPCTIQPDVAGVGDTGTTRREGRAPIQWAKTEVSKDCAVVDRHCR